jgi:chromosomal replication initiation ATPase DnaA
MTPIRQLGLPFVHTQAYRATDFLAGACNHDALAWLDHPWAWPGLRLALFGENGCGKTHLLHVFVARTGARLLPGTAVRGLLDLNDVRAVAVDDADAGPDPRALLHLLNAAAERLLPVLLAGRTPPTSWPYTLPDLMSRLRAMPVVELRHPDDALLDSLLARLLAERQLAVAAPVQAYIRLRAPRTGDALREVAARLDRASLAAGGKVTRGLAGCVLADMGCEDLATGASVGSLEDGLPF